MSTLSKCATMLLLLVAGRAWASEELGPEAAFSRGAELMQKRQFKEAVPYLKQAEKAFPTTPSVLWNLGIASAELANHAEALNYWEKYRKAKPEDWKAIPKVIQAFQAMGDTRARDREIKALYDRRAKDPDPDLRKADRFCREQFVVAGRKVFAFEVFDPQGDRRIYYRFSIIDGVSGRETSFISLGSYDATTAIARELGEIPKTARAYHIDRYEGASHQTYAHFNEKPSYETVRKATVEILGGKARAVSGSSRAGAAQPER